MDLVNGNLIESTLMIEFHIHEGPIPLAEGLGDGCKPIPLN
jgi:hypothetical protein